MKPDNVHGEMSCQFLVPFTDFSSCADHVRAGIANIVSNVPAVLLLRPVIADFADPARDDHSLAMASTFGGHLTLVSSVANLIRRGSRSGCADPPYGTVDATHATIGHDASGLS